MKVWLGVIGRACLEFAIILVLISFAAGASQTISSPRVDIGAIYRSAAKAGLDLVPLAVIFTLFLAFFSFELRVRSRAAGARRHEKYLGHGSFLHYVYRHGSYVEVPRCNTHKCYP